MFTLMKSSSSVLLFCLLGALLQGCGAERDTPFNPDSSDSSNSSLGTVINNDRELAFGTKPITAPRDLNRKLLAIREPGEMDELWAEYVGTNGPTWQSKGADFEEGQVLLIDRGQIGGCEPLINYDSIKFYDHSPNSVKVVIRYSDSGKPRSSSSSSSSSVSSSSFTSSSSAYSEPDCDSGFSNINQPFRFYYVPSRKVLIFQEDIE